MRKNPRNQLISDECLSALKDSINKQLTSTEAFMLELRFEHKISLEWISDLYYLGGWGHARRKIESILDKIRPDMENHR